MNQIHPINLFATAHRLLPDLPYSLCSMLFTLRSMLFADLKAENAEIKNEIQEIRKVMKRIMNAQVAMHDK